MSEKTMTPVGRMAALLAETTERAVELERQRDAAKEDAENWYRLFSDRDKKLHETKVALDAQIKENEELRSAIAEYIKLTECIENIEKGAPENE